MFWGRWMPKEDLRLMPEDLGAGIWVPTLLGLGENGYGEKLHEAAYRSNWKPTEHPILSFGHQPSATRWFRNSIAWPASPNWRNGRTRWHTASFFHRWRELPSSTSPRRLPLHDPTATLWHIQRLQSWIDSICTRENSESNARWMDITCLISTRCPSRIKCRAPGAGEKLTRMAYRRDQRRRRPNLGRPRQEHARESTPINWQCLGVIVEEWGCDTWICTQWNRLIMNNNLNHLWDPLNQ